MLSNGEVARAANGRVQVPRVHRDNLVSGAGGDVVWELDAEVSRSRDCVDAYPQIWDGRALKLEGDDWGVARLRSP